MILFWVDRVHRVGCLCGLCVYCWKRKGHGIVILLHGFPYNYCVKWCQMRSGLGYIEEKSGVTDSPTYWCK